jgi:hypothetical protein
MLYSRSTCNGRFIPFIKMGISPLSIVEQNALIECDDYLSEKDMFPYIVILLEKSTPFIPKNGNFSDKYR